MVLQIAGALLILGVLLGIVGFIFFLLENIHRLNIQPKLDSYFALFHMDLADFSFL